jgi:hypothetical protein
MMMNEEADPDDLQAVFAHEYEDVYDFQVKRRQHPFTYLLVTWRDGCGGSGSGLDPDSIGSVDPDPDPGGKNDPQK